MDWQKLVDQFALFAQDRWYVLLIAIILLIVIIKIVKTVVKWVLVLLIAAGVLYYGANYTEKLSEIGGQLLDQAREEALNVLAGNAGEARYRENPDGTFTVEAPNLIIEGRQGEDRVRITFRGQSLEVNAGGWIRDYIERAKRNE